MSSINLKLLALLPLLSLISLIPYTSAQETTTRVPHGTCTESRIPVSISASNYILKFAEPPVTQQVVTDVMLRFTSDPEKTLGEILQGSEVNNRTYGINTLFCVPDRQDERGTVELGVHGVAFDHTYWTLGGPGSKYNYVDAALQAGHAILVYDRLGTGKSDKPDGLREVQGPTQVEVAVQLARYLQGSPRGRRFGRVVGVGHSFGSITLVHALAKYGNLFNATVITGITANQTTFLPGLATQTLTIARENNPKRFGSLRPEYLVLNNIINLQQNFFAYPNYDPEILKLSEATKWTATVAEFLTAGGPPAEAYTNPVLIVTGDKDYIACGANCLKEVDGVNLVEGTKALFPSTSNYSTYIPKNTGHGLTAHLSTPDTHAAIQKWISELP